MDNTMNVTNQNNGNTMQNKSGSDAEVSSDVYSKVGKLTLRNHPSQVSSDDNYDSSEYSSDDNRGTQKNSYMKRKVYKSLNSGSFNTDSSDIEVLLDDKNNSSDSIEVLDTEKPPDQTWSCNLDRQDTVIEQKAEKAQDTGNEAPDVSEASDNVSRSDTNPSTHDTLSDTATILSNSSASNFDESKNNSPRNTKLSSKDAEDTQTLSESPDARMADRSQQLADYYSPSGSSYGSPIHQANPTCLDTVANGTLSSRPDSLVLPRPLQYIERQRLTKKESLSSQSEVSNSSSMDALIEQASQTPLTMQGMVTREGDMMSFVAEGLTDMIKRSSPMSRSRTESSVSSWSVGRSGAQTPSGRSVSSMSSSTSGWDSSASSVTGYSYSNISRSASELTQSPDDIPPVDPRALMDLETHAHKTAASLQHMMDTLTKNLHKMSSLTNKCLGAYKDGVDNTCDAVDSSIKSMYALMAKCEELSKAMRPIYGLQEQIKEIKRLLDLFEAQMAKYDKS